MDIGRELKANVGIAPDAYAAGTTNGGAVDTKGFHEALVILNAGVAEATSTLNVKVQESANGSTGWADIAGAAFAEVTAANDAAVYQGRVRITASRKRYLRIVGVGATDAADYGVAVILGDAVNKPAGAANAFDIHG